MAASLPIFRESTPPPIAKKEMPRLSLKEYHARKFDPLPAEETLSTPADEKVEAGACSLDPTPLEAARDRPPHLDLLSPAPAKRPPSFATFDPQVATSGSTSSAPPQEFEELVSTKQFPLDLVVKQIPRTWNEPKIRIFLGALNIHPLNIILKIPRHDPRFQGTIFIKFASPDAVDEALKKLHLKPVGGTGLVLQAERRRGGVREQKAAREAEREAAGNPPPPNPSMDPKSYPWRNSSVWEAVRGRLGWYNPANDEQAPNSSLSRRTGSSTPQSGSSSSYGPATTTIDSANDYFGGRGRGGGGVGDQGGAEIGGWGRGRGGSCSERDGGSGGVDRQPEGGGYRGWEGRRERGGGYGGDLGGGEREWGSRGGGEFGERGTKRKWEGEQDSRSPPGARGARGAEGKRALAWLF